jgi:hypothetical protein
MPTKLHIAKDMAHKLNLKKRMRRLLAYVLSILTAGVFFTALVFPLGFAYEDSPERCLPLFQNL